MASLIQLPLEILLEISEKLVMTDYCSLRQTCKIIDDTLFESFGHEFFRTRQCMLMESSLEGLVDISESRFSPFVKIVILGLEQFTLIPTKILEPTAIDKNQYYIDYVSQSTLLATGQDVVMLTEALSNLRLIASGISDCDHRKKGEREVRGKQKGSVDVFTTYEQAGITTTYQTQISRAMESAFIAAVLARLLCVLGRCKSGPRALCLTHTQGFPDGGFYVPSYLQDTLASALSSLEYFSVRILGPATCGNFDRLITRGTSETPVRIQTYCLRRFLAFCTNLHHLSISQRQMDGDFSADRFFSWLAEPVSLPPPNEGPVQSRPGSVALKSLRILTIYGTTMFSTEIVALVTKFRSTLRQLILYSVTLYAKHDVISPEIWSECLQKVARSGVKLVHVEFTALRVVTKQGAERLISFEINGQEERIIDHAGAGTMEFLETLASSVNLSRRGSTSGMDGQ
jgi:hypothetical protein